MSTHIQIFIRKNIQITCFISLSFSLVYLHGTTTFHQFLRRSSSHGPWLKCWTQTRLHTVPRNPNCHQIQRPFLHRTSLLIVLSFTWFEFLHIAFQSEFYLYLFVQKHWEECQVKFYINQCYVGIKIWHTFVSSEPCWEQNGRLCSTLNWRCFIFLHVLRHSGFWF